MKSLYLNNLLLWHHRLVQIDLMMNILFYPIWRRIFNNVLLCVERCTGHEWNINKRNSSVFRDTSFSIRDGTYYPSPPRLWTGVYGVQMRLRLQTSIPSERVWIIWLYSMNERSWSLAMVLFAEDFNPILLLKKRTEEICSWRASFWTREGVDAAKWRHGRVSGQSSVWTYSLPLFGYSSRALTLTLHMRIVPGSSNRSEVSTLGRRCVASFV